MATQKCGLGTIAERVVPPAIAYGMTIAYAAWLQPEWEPIRDDQQQYLALAHGLAERGEFTRAVAGEAFIPEPLRAPGYPMLVAALCRTVGCGHWQIAIMQALLFALMVVLVAGVSRRILSTRAALVATTLVSVYPPLAYFAALSLSDLLATLLIVFAGYALIRGGTLGLALTGLALGLAALSRPFFLPVVLPFLCVAYWRGAARPSRIGVLLVTFVLVVAPLFLYSFAVFGRPFTGSSGTQLWLGYFELRGAELDSFERTEADAGAERIKAFVAEVDRSKQPTQFLQLDADLGARAVRLIEHDPLGYAARAVPRSVLLWAGDVPVKQGTALPTAARMAAVAGELVLLLFGVVGAIVLARRSVVVAAVLPLTVIGYVQILSLPLWAEGRFSLPAKPFLIVAAVAGVAAVLRRRRPRQGATESTGWIRSDR